MAQNRASQSEEQELISTILSFKYSPVKHMQYAFPWEKENTPLANYGGPRQWQMDDFKMIEDHLQSDAEAIRRGDPPRPLYLSRSSGRGIGKSAQMAMLSNWVMSTWLGSTTIITANTETQLRSRTMAEVGKWNTMAINSHWFDKSAMAVRPASWFADMLKKQLKLDTQYYYAEAQTWSEENPDAFAGAHSTIGMCLLMDEGSGIADNIWGVSEGFFTDLAPLRLWVVYSNPRRNTGKFFESFHRDRAFWNTKSIDSRTVEGLDSSVYQRIADKYGEDSDETRVEVKGEFPRKGDTQFISREVVSDATMREVTEDHGAPLIMGIDIARFGDDTTEFVFRQGRNARGMPNETFKGLDTVQVAARAAESIDKHRPDAVMVDGGGVGGGVVDRLKELGYPVHEIQSGSSPADKSKYINMRGQMWGDMAEWLVYGTIDDNDDLVSDLTGPEYSIDLQSRIRLERKDEMKKRGLASPNKGDGLALTFGKKIARKDMPMSLNRKRPRFATGMDYDIFS